MKVLITGSTGLIGKELGRELTERGHEIVVLVRDSVSAASLLPFPANSISWSDVKSSQRSSEAEDILREVEAVIHLAGEPIAERRWTGQRKKSLRESRVDLTQDLVRLARECMPSLRVFIQGSAIGVYGERADDELDFESGVGEGFLPNLVKDWEAAAKPIVGGKNIRLVTVRTGIVLSRFGGALTKMLPIFRKGLGARLGLRGNQWMSWIHLSDIVGIFRWALENSNVEGVIEGVAPAPVRNRDFTNELCRALGVIQGPPVPEAILRLLYGEMATILLESARVIPRRTTEFGYRFVFPDFASAIEELIAPLRKRTYEKREEQWVPVPVENLWPYFCDERNLESLTPPLLRFEVLGKSTPEISSGTLIDYRLRLNGVPFRWRTLIEDWVPNKKFVDRQLKGPYSLWHHTHEFIPLAGGTLMRDRVLYRLPVGLLGDFCASWKVVRDVDSIFKYRRKVIHERFGHKFE
jgi:uncharacterized protein (TIGR01777 family)